MTQHEKLVVSAYTGVLMVTFDELHKYIEETLGRPVWTHELAYDYITEELKHKVKSEFIKLCEETE